MPTDAHKPPFPDYMGDGVYVHFDGFNLVITTSHHDPRQADNVIAIEPEVWAALHRYRDRLIAELPDFSGRFK